MRIAANEPIPFVELIDRVDRSPREQAKIGRVHRHIHFREIVCGAVEEPRQVRLPDPVPRAAADHAINDVETLFPLLQELTDQLGRILKIAEQDHRRLPASEPKTGRHRGLEAEIAAELYIAPTIV